MLEFEQFNDISAFFWTNGSRNFIVKIRFRDVTGWCLSELNSEYELTQEETQQISDKLAELNALEATKMVII
mgnify:CR=1 FL=1